GAALLASDGWLCSSVRGDGWPSRAASRCLRCRSGSRPQGIKQHLSLAAVNAARRRTPPDGKPAPSRLPFETTHDLPTLPSLIWIDILPSGQKRAFSWIINGLMLKVTIRLESHEDEQTCHFNRGSQATLVEGDLARVTASN